jgi:hypothetical protein
MGNDKPENRCAMVPISASLSAEEGYEWARDAMGEPGVAVCRLYGKAGITEPSESPHAFHLMLDEFF